MQRTVHATVDGVFIGSKSVILNFNPPATEADCIDQAWEDMVDDGLVSNADRAEAKFVVREGDPIYTIDELKSGRFTIGIQREYSGLVSSQGEYNTEAEAEADLIKKIGFRTE